MSVTHHEISSIKKFLDNEYYIPNYQREYSWETDQIQEFWNDLEETISLEKEITHFFGQIVAHNDDDNKKKYIIDGQQRTITSIIFLNVLKEKYHQLYKDSDNSLDDANYAEMNISRDYIGAKAPFHLTLGDESDNDCFIDIISNKNSNEKKSKKFKKKSHINMYSTYNFFDNKVSEMLDEKTDIEEKLTVLNTLFNTFSQRFTVLYMETTQLEEAYIIFETLNARGKDLEAADLLKNFLFGRVKNDVEYAQKKWSDMLDNLGGADPTKYIRSYWNSVHGLTNEKALYRNISQKIKTPKAGKELLRNLEAYSMIYHDIMHPDETSWFEDKDIIFRLKNLKTLRAATFYPVVIAMVDRDFDERDIAIVLKDIEILYFRNNTICKNASNTMERFFAQLAQDITEESLDKVEEICTEIRKQKVEDNVFEEAFYIWSGKQKEIIRYILYMIHLYLTHNATKVNTDNDVVHIEHIMPSNNSVWKVDESIHSEYLWRLGNLALMLGKANIKASNKLFSEKKEMYKESQILPNPDVYDYETWGSEEIDDRQKKLCQYAMMIWKI